MVIDPVNPSAEIPFSLLVLILAALTTMSFITLRFAVSLVGTAMEKPMGFKAAWTATKPLAGTILGVAFVLVLINLVPSLLQFVIGSTAPILLFVLNICLSWLTMMLGISILTTIYGHVVEERPLVS